MMSLDTHSTRIHRVCRPLLKQAVYVANLIRNYIHITLKGKNFENMLHQHLLYVCLLPRILKLHSDFCHV